MGTKLMPLPADPRVRFAGMLPDEERLHALEAASVVVVPSPYESLSLLALEAFAVGTPVLVNARSEVLVEHCRRSHAGLYYADRWEFSEALNLLLGDEALRAAMGRHGKAYINRHYRWSTILTKYERLFARLRGQTREAVPPEPSGARTSSRQSDRAAATDGPRDTRDRDGAQRAGREGARGRDGRRDRPRSGDRRRDQGRSGRPRR
jgi:hypothetical protein